MCSFHEVHLTQKYDLAATFSNMFTHQEKIIKII